MVFWSLRLKKSLEARGIEVPALPDGSDHPRDLTREPDLSAGPGVSRHHPTTSLRALWDVVVRRRRLVLGIEGGLLLACLLYCLIAPNQYEASARVELRTSPASALSLDLPEQGSTASMVIGARSHGDAGRRVAQRPTGMAGDHRIEALPGAWLSWQLCAPLSRVSGRRAGAPTPKPGCWRDSSGGCTWRPCPARC